MSEPDRPYDAKYTHMEISFQGNITDCVRFRLDLTGAFQFLDPPSRFYALADENVRHSMGDHLKDPAAFFAGDCLKIGQYRFRLRIVHVDLNKEGNDETVAPDEQTEGYAKLIEEMDPFKVRPTPRRVTQIVMSGVSIIALCSDATLWARDAGDAEWTQLSTPPGE